LNIDSGVSACPIASIFPSLVKCWSAIALTVFDSFVENSSPVRPWIYKWARPSVCQPLFHIMLMLTLGVFIETRLMIVHNAGGPSSGYDGQNF